jgi:hypothetical protein
VCNGMIHLKMSVYYVGPHAVTVQGPLRIHPIGTGLHDSNPGVNSND